MWYIIGFTKFGKGEKWCDYYCVTPSEILFVYLVLKIPTEKCVTISLICGIIYAQFLKREAGIWYGSKMSKM